MARREDWPNDKVAVYQIKEKFTEERDGKKWTSKIVSYESFRYSWYSEPKQISDYMFNKYLSKLSENYDVDYRVFELTNEILGAVQKATIWEGK